jgi:phosphate transport system protein
MEHTVKSYEAELVQLDQKLSQMGGLVERLLGDAFASLERRDPRLASEAIAADQAIDSLQKEIEELAISMIARRQPMAQDLRLIVSTLKVAGDLERIGDLAKNIAKRSLAVASESRPQSLILGLRHMAELAMRSLKNVLDAYMTRDDEKALKVWRADTDIDALYNSVFRELLTYMMEDPRNIGLCTHLLFGAKNIERIGDHATNIAETIHYMVRGKPLVDDRPKGDKTSVTLIDNDPGERN